MNEVFLMRHGIAVHLGEQGIRRDGDRMLSQKGRERTRQVAESWSGTVHGVECTWGPRPETTDCQLSFSMPSSEKLVQKWTSHRRTR